MQTQTIERARTRAPHASARIVAYLGAAAFVIAVAWYGLATNGVTVSPEPAAEPNVPVEQAMRAHYRWLATTLPQERLNTAIAIAGFLCLAAVAAFARDLLGRDRSLARIGAFLIGGGAGLWIIGSDVVTDPTGQARRAYHAHGGAHLIRPDGHIAASGVQAIDAYLRRVYKPEAAGHAVPGGVTPAQPFWIGLLNGWREVALTRRAAVMGADRGPLTRSDAHQILGQAGRAHPPRVKPEPALRREA
jgi:hypothetical protein